MTGKSSTRLRLSTGRLLFALTATGLALGIGLPLILGMADGESAATAEHRRRIALMTSAERERLERLYAEYQALSETERERLRNLHRQIVRSPVLSQTLEKYKIWLASLSPWQRKELREEGDYGLRLGIVQSLRQSQSEERDSRRQRDASRFRHFGPLAWGYFRSEPDGSREPVYARWLSGRDLVRVMEIVRQSLPDADELQSALQSEPAAQYGRILREALMQGHSSEGPTREDLNWPVPQLFDRIVGAIEDERDKACLIDGERDLHTRQLKLVAMLGRSIDRLWEDHAESLNPSEEDRLRIFNRLDQEEQSRIAQMSGPKRDEHIRWRFKMERRREFFREISGLVEVLDRIFPDHMPRRSFSRNSIRGHSK